MEIGSKGGTGKENGRTVRFLEEKDDNQSSPFLSIVLLSGETFRQPNKKKKATRQAPASTIRCCAKTVCNQSTSSLHSSDPDTAVERKICRSKLLKQYLSRSEVNLQQSQLPETDLKILEILLERQHERKWQEERAENLEKIWEREKETRNQDNIAIEKERRAIITLKREEEKLKLHERMEKFKDSLAATHACIGQVLENGKEFQKQFKEEGCDDHCLIRRKLKVNPENHCKASRIKKDVEENEKSNRSIKMGIASREEKCHSSRRKEKIECLHKENINQIRTSLESRLEKAACDYAKQRKEKEEKIARNKKDFETKREKVLSLKRELDEGLEKWGDQVITVQENNLRRAAEQVEKNRNRKRERSREDRRSREKRVKERRKQSKEREDEDIRRRRADIEAKEKRINSFLRERERSIERQRKLAEKAALLRRSVRSQSCSSQVFRGTIEAVL